MLGIAGVVACETLQAAATCYLICSITVLINNYQKTELGKRARKELQTICKHAEVHLCNHIGSIVGKTCLSGLAQN